jgi:hypothetical protein
VIKMLSQASGVSNSKLSPMMSSIPENLQVGAIGNVFGWTPSVYTSRGYGIDKNMPVDQLHAKPEFISSKNQVSVWPNCNPHVPSTQFATALLDNSAVSSDLVTAPWPHSDVRPAGPPPPKVFVEESWPSLGTEIWSQHTGWSPGKT